MSKLKVKLFAASALDSSNVGVPKSVSELKTNLYFSTFISDKFIVTLKFELTETSVSCICKSSVSSVVAYAKFTKTYEKIIIKIINKIDIFLFIKIILSKFVKYNIQSKY